MKFYQYVFAGPYKTADRARDSMEDSFCDGEIDHTQNPQVMALRDHRGKVTGYAVVLDDSNMRDIR